MSIYNSVRKQSKNLKGYTHRFPFTLCHKEYLIWHTVHPKISIFRKKKNFVKENIKFTIFAGEKSKVKKNNVMLYYGMVSRITTFRVRKIWSLILWFLVFWSDREIC